MDPSIQMADGDVDVQKALRGVLNSGRTRTGRVPIRCRDGRNLSACGSNDPTTARLSAP